MALSLKEKQQFKNYVVDVLVEKFNYQKEIAEELVANSRVIEEFENNLGNEPESVMNFDPQFMAEKLVSKNK
ncbi:hypothetical protein IRP63_02635 [Clostridium botulinum]|uniref:Uncharacterized protein n=1 Tax=Clostridium botulinum C/D str. DC5 TaxID=1443128 RepID=A0A0A0IFA0_CLOBO|nr:hypothetical protein [Clostridium botulinum]KEI07352.1 hypothetical protein Z952_09020 [Clostridium botulinum C/D str. BKT75002]KEI11435.1 hypothetical protein Z954_07720 [Clostridium botulinum C/D str. BKT2873]KGM95348.1 hypothetical protein Z956_05100 [Clostridium botulinum D str. CCUG 7971]KGM99662.1 hypothetical protein Z955_06495 [Clostridium botulinum C/D str. DC5]KOC47537.1 hypothetical protein ADU88_09990 [Clostridium botulinum]